MRNFFVNEGNLGNTPTLKYVPVKNSSTGEQRAVLEMDVKFNRETKNKTSGAYEDNGGFWARVQIWDKRAEIFNNYLQKGCRVLVVGEFSQRMYIATKGAFAGQERPANSVTATSIAIVPFGIDSIVFSKKRDVSGESDSLPDDYEEYPEYQEPVEA